MNQAHRLRFRNSFPFPGDIRVLEIPYLHMGLSNMCCSFRAYAIHNKRDIHVKKTHVKNDSFPILSTFQRQALIYFIIEYSHFFLLLNKIIICHDI